MTRSASAILALTAAALMFSAVPASAAQPASHDVTNLFTDAGLKVDQLRAIDVDGILVLRGRTPETANAEAAGQYARSIGYARVANLIQVSGPIDDERIERLAERELAIHRSLDGCHLTIDSTNGVVRLGGAVQHELQKDVALQLVRSIRGVKSVSADLRRF